MRHEVITMKSKMRGFFIIDPISIIIMTVAAAATIHTAVNGVHTEQPVAEANAPESTSVDELALNVPTESSALEFAEPIE